MLLFGLALLAGGIVVLVRLRAEFRVDPRRWVDQTAAVLLALAALLWRPRRPARRVSAGRPAGSRESPRRSGGAGLDRPRPENSGPRTEVLRDPVTRLAARPRAVGRAVPPPSSLLPPSPG